jgi:hypothetical protein
LPTPANEAQLWDEAFGALSDGRDAGPSPTKLGMLRWVALAAVAAHVAAYAWLTHLDRFFASEDDPYRIYNAFLMARGGTIIGRFWLPGQLLAMSVLQLLGVPARWSGILVGVAALVALAWALVEVTRMLAPEPVRETAPWAALLLAASSPLTLALGHSALAEPLESALVLVSAAAVLRRARGGPRWTLALGALALLLATWVRFESWAIALVLPGIVFFLERRLGRAIEAAARDAAVVALAWLGPIAWMWAQAVHYGSPLAFLERIDELSMLTHEPSLVRVLANRAKWQMLWAPAALVWSAAAVVLLRHRRRALVPLVGFALFTSLGVIAGVGSGPSAVLAFTPRLGYGLEVALWPLAAVGLALAFARTPRLALLASVATVATLGVGVVRPADMQDTSSVAAGLLLRRGELDSKVGTGSLLVERLPRRPPFGWASVGVLWGHWDRTLWGTLRGDGWQLVEPTDVHAGLRGVPEKDFPTWLNAHDVTSAWMLSSPSLDEIRAAWPHCRLTQIGEGTLVSRE